MSSLENLRKEMTRIKPLVERVVNSHLHSESCHLMGLTGAGKSTFTCYMMGASLDFKGRGLNYQITHSSSNLPSIGNSSFSCTTIPGLYVCPDNLVIYDPPGFQATTGTNQQIIDSYCNANMFQLGRQAKILVLIEFPTLQSSRGKGVADVARQLSKLFDRNFNQVINSCLLVVTKVDTRTPDIDQKIRETLFEISGLSEVLRQGQMLLNSVLQLNRIICFPTPELINLDRINIINSVKNKIRQVPSFHVSAEPRISLSADSKNALMDMLVDIEDQRKEICKNISEELKTTFKNKMSTKEEMQASLLNIGKAKDILSSDVKGKDGKDGKDGLFNRKAQLQSLLCISKEKMNELDELDSQIQFCLTIDRDILYSSECSTILKSKLTQIQSHIQKQLSKIMNKEQIKKMNEDFQMERDKKARQHLAEIQRINCQSEQRYNKLKEESQRINEQNQAKYVQMQQKFMAQINKINEDRQKYKNKQLDQIKQQIGNMQGQLRDNQVMKIQTQLYSQKEKNEKLSKQLEQQKQKAAVQSRRQRDKQRELAYLKNRKVAIRRYKRQNPQNP